VQAIVGWLVGFWDHGDELWLSVGDVVEWLMRWGNMVIWWRWVDVELLLSLARLSIQPLLLLAKDANSILQFYYPRMLLVDVLSLSLGMLGSCLSSHE
jgi:hypothetical protein